MAVARGGVRVDPPDRVRRERECAHQSPCPCPALRGTSMRTPPPAVGRLCTDFSCAISRQLRPSPLSRSRNSDRRGIPREADRATTRGPTARRRRSAQAGCPWSAAFSRRARRCTCRECSDRRRAHLSPTSPTAAQIQNSLAQGLDVFAGDHLVVPAQEVRVHEVALRQRHATATHEPAAGQGRALEGRTSCTVEYP